jgi:hypothetical protein
MSEAEARTLAEECMKVMYYRNTRSSSKIQVAVVTDAGVKIGDAYELETRWGFDAFKHTEYNGINGVEPNGGVPVAAGAGGQ